MGTDHPRILTATEAFLPPAMLFPLLDRLMQYCQARDIAAIRALLVEAPTGYGEAREGFVPPPGMGEGIRVLQRRA